MRASRVVWRYDAVCILSLFHLPAPPKTNFLSHKQDQGQGVALTTEINQCICKAGKGGSGVNGAVACPFFSSLHQTWITYLKFHSFIH